MSFILAAGIQPFNLTFEVMMDTTLVANKFVAKVWKIGSNLPCLISKFGEDPITLNGITILNIGDACPLSFGDNLEENTFTVTGCSEIAKQTNYPLLCKSTFSTTSMFVAQK